MTFTDSVKILRPPCCQNLWSLLSFYCNMSATQLPPSPPAHASLPACQVSLSPGQVPRLGWVVLSRPPLGALRDTTPGSRSFTHSPDLASHPRLSPSMLTSPKCPPPAPASPESNKYLQPLHQLHLQVETLVSQSAQDQNQILTSGPPLTALLPILSTLETAMRSLVTWLLPLRLHMQFFSRLAALT